MASMKRRMFYLPGLVIILLFFHFITVTASNSDSLSKLDKLDTLINQLQENSNYHASIGICNELLLQAAAYDEKRVRKYIIRAHLFRAEAYRDLGLDNLFSAELTKINALLERYKPDGNSARMISTQFAYLIYSGDYFLTKKRILEATNQFNSAYQFVLSHPEYYGDNMVRDSIDCRQLRLFQCLSRLGLIAMEASDFTEAANKFQAALRQAREADQVVLRIGRPPQGLEEQALIDLMKLGLALGDFKMTEHYSKMYDNVNKSKAYEQHRQKDLIYTFLQNQDLTRQAGLHLISMLNENKLAATDIAIQLPVLGFYLKQGMRDSCNMLLQRLEKKANRLADISALFRIKAELKASLGDYMAMSEALDSSLHYLTVDKSNEDIWEDLGLRNQFLETVMKGIQFHNLGYKNCGEVFFIQKKTRLLSYFTSGLRAIRNDLIADEDRLSFIQKLTPVLDLALETYSDSLQLADQDELSILTCFEAGKAFNLHAESILRKFLSDAEFANFTSLSSELRSVRSQMQNPGYNYDSLLEKMTDLNSRLRLLKHRYNHMADAPFQRLGQIQSRLDRNTTLLEYFKGSTHIYALLINQNEFRLTRLPGSSDAVSQLIGDLQLSISLAGENEYSKLRDSLYRTAGWKLFQALLGPLADHIRRRLIVLPDLDLAQIPFGALLTAPANHSDHKNWPYLIHRHVISSQYSLALWMEPLRQGQPVMEEKWSKSLISFAPVFEDLIYNREECKAIAMLMDDVSGFQDEEADSANFSRFAKEGMILHIASHARSHGVNQGESYIRLAGDTLFSGEIGLMHLPQALVFLSACETGTGKIISGEGVMSLARSFFQAGSRSVISTLWPIRDDLSKNQVVEVYRNLRAGQPKDKAIRNMQMEYINRAAFGQAFPAFWAAYQSQGDQGSLFLNHMISLGYILGLAPILALGLAFLFYRKYFGVSQLTAFNSQS